MGRLMMICKELRKMPSTSRGVGDAASHAAQKPADSLRSQSFIFPSSPRAPSAPVKLFFPRKMSQSAREAEAVHKAAAEKTTGIVATTRKVFRDHPFVSVLGAPAPRGKG
jgi:hypothetical protein